MISLNLPVSSRTTSPISSIPRREREADVDLIKTEVEHAPRATFGKDRVEKKEARRKRGARYFISGYLHSARRKPVQSRRENFVHDSSEEHIHTLPLLFIN